jgi:hypothetical protein
VIQILDSVSDLGFLVLVVGSLGGGLVDGSCRVGGGYLCAFPFGS